MNNKKLTHAALLGLMLAGSSIMAQAEELRIGTASMGGAFYPVGQAASNLVNEYADGYTMVPVVTQGGTQNPRLVANGEVDIAIGNANTSLFAYEGSAPYDDAVDIRSIGTLHSSVLHIVTLAGSEIQSVADLEGKRVAVGPAGGGTLNLLNDVLAAFDLSFGDISPSFLSYTDGFSQLKDGSVDASVALAGYPAGAVLQASVTDDIAFIDIGEDKLEKITDEYAYYSAVEVPAEAYSTGGPITLLGTKNILIASANTDEEKIYELTKAIYGNLEEFAAQNVNARQIVAADAYDIALPLHPGAKRFFDEQ